MRLGPKGPFGAYQLWQLARIHPIILLPSFIRAFFSQIAEHQPADMGLQQIS